MEKISKLVVAFLVIAVAVALFFFLVNSKFGNSGVESNTQHYLSFNGDQTKIWLAATATSYSAANETYITPDGQVVLKGDPLFIISVTLRNDYTSDNPPPLPPKGISMSPADGTAYLYFTAQLHNPNGAVNATNVSVSDFSIPATSGTGLVLASGQTASATIYMSTTQTNINRCDINMIYVGDSLPT